MMKSTVSPVPLLLLGLLLAGCLTDSGPTNIESRSGSPVFSAWVGPNPDPVHVICVTTGCAVSPTGDMTGVADANNLEYALDRVRMDGTEVLLTDGDPTSVDEYYVSRNVVVASFSGTLRGEGMDNTFINGVRRSPAAGDGFRPAPSEYWQKANPSLQFPTLLQFDYSAGPVMIADLTARVAEAEPVDPYFLGGTLRTKLNTLIEILGGDQSTTLENVRLRGGAGAAGSLLPSNVYIGVHVMPGDGPGFRGTGVLRVRNLHVEHIDWGAAFMFFEDSQLDVAGVTARNVSYAIDIEVVHNSSAVVTGSDIQLHPQGASGFVLRDIPSGAEISGNTITGSRLPAIRMVQVDNATVTGNVIRDHHVDVWWAAAIYGRQSSNNRIAYNTVEDVQWRPYVFPFSGGILLRFYSNGNTVDHNDFGKSGLPGWTPATPYGPGAIMLGFGAAPVTIGNSVFEMKFPAGTGKTLCEMVWDLSDDPSTTEYDGTNDIHAWQPCENLAERDARGLANVVEPAMASVHHQEPQP